MFRTCCAFVLPFAMIALTGCNFGPECFQTTLRGSATIERAGIGTPVDLFGSIYSYQLFERFETTRDFLTGGGVGSSSISVAWSFGSSEVGSWAIGLRGPRTEGEVIPVTTGAFQMLYPGDPTVWGPTSMPLAAEAQAALKIDGLDATPASGGLVSGTLTVRQIRPLSLAADLVAQDAEGEQLRLRGDMTFQTARDVCP